MPEAIDTNIGILKVHMMPIFDIHTECFGTQMSTKVASQKLFRILTIRKRHVENVSSKIKAILAEWSIRKKLDLIFLLGDSDFPSIAMTEELKATVLQEAPHLSSLLFGSNRRYDCCILEKSIVFKLPLNLHDYEFDTEILVPDLFLAMKDIRSLNFSFAFPPDKRETYLDLHKSNVILTKVAERNRKSPYEMISVEKATDIILKESCHMKTVHKTFRDCFSFVLAEDITTEEPYPAFPASVKDGYAVLGEDTSVIRKVIGSTSPGYKPEIVVTAGTCMRVSTGSVIPNGANAVIQVEDTIVAEKDEEGNELKIEILKPVEVMQDIRPVGSDIAKGQILVQANEKISAAEIGIMSICGIQKVLVYEKPWVALLSTGDEVLEPDAVLQPGCIRDSNKSSLLHILMENRIPVVDLGIAKDKADDVKSHLMLSLETCDIIISTGGVSMGEKDMLKQVLRTDFNATVHFGRIHMKPGKPTTFSTLIFNGQKKLVFSLPGNPVSAVVCFYLFVIPCIKKMMGFKQSKHIPVKVKLGFDLKLDERPEFYRVCLKCGNDGIFTAHGTGGQQSSRLLSMQNADALLMLPPRTSELSMLTAGKFVDAISLKPI